MAARGLFGACVAICLSGLAVLLLCLAIGWREPRVTFGLLAGSLICAAAAVATAYSTVRPSKQTTAYMGDVFAAGFWRSSGAFRACIIGLGLIGLLTFAIGASALPRGNDVEERSGAFFRIDDGREHQISVSEATFLVNARDVLSPVGGALALSAFTLGLLKGTIQIQRRPDDGLQAGHA